MMRTARMAHSFWLFLILLSTDAVFSQVATGLPEPEFRKDELVVKFRDYDSSGILERTRKSARLAELVRKYGVAETKPLIPLTSKLMRAGDAAVADSARRKGIERIQILRLAANSNVLTAAREFAALPEIEYAEPNYIYHLFGFPNDPYLTSSGGWGQNYLDLWGHFQINASSAWNIGTGKGVIVGVVDTGCDLTHPDLKENIWTNPAEIPGNGIDDDSNGYVDDVHGWNFYSPGEPPSDLNGHGTHLAGTIAATGNNGIGIAGVAHEAKVLPIVGIDESGGGYASLLAEGILYGVASGARVLNLSWGGAGISRVIEDAIELAWAHKVIVVAAAGNNGVYLDNSDMYPAKSRYVITVGASTPTENLAYFSNYGSVMDVVAPGGGDSTEPVYNILSLRSSTIGSSGLRYPMFWFNEQYMLLAGTSMAAPHAAAVAALILQVRPDIGPEEVRQIMRSSTTDALNPGWDFYSGYGLVNAGQAVMSRASGSARIIEPAPKAHHDESLTLMILANAEAFTGYTLEYCPVSRKDRFDEDQGPWTTIHSSAVPADGIDVRAWNVAEIPDGDYLLRLRVSTDTGNLYYDRIAIELDRASLSSPEYNAAFRAGARIRFKGSVGGGSFRRYTLDYQDPATGIWSSRGMQLADDGREKVSNGLIAEWDSPEDAAAGFYRVRMVIQRENLPDEVRETQVILDRSFHPGWPISIPKESYYGCSTNAAAADLDGDGVPEILVACVSNILAFRSDGNNIDGWPPRILVPDTVLSSPKVGDVDGDGWPEVVSVNLGYGQVFIWRRNGQLMPGWPKTMDVDIRNITVADLNFDGRDEIIGEGFSNVIVFDVSGTVWSGWPKLASEERTTTPSGVAVGDLDNDGKKEIVIQNERGKQSLYVFDSDGNLRPGWPISLISSGSTWFENQPVIADINNDGKGEILAHWYGFNDQGFGEGIIGIFSADGTMLPGWPVRATGRIFYGAGSADINGDSLLEVLVGSQDQSGVPTMFAWTGSGSAVPGWPVKNDSYFGHFNSPVFADVDGDGIEDVVATSGGSATGILGRKPWALSAYSRNGTPIFGFPKPVAFEAWQIADAPLIDDFDGDGLQEMVWLCPSLIYQLFMWDLDAPAKHNVLDWSVPGYDSGGTWALPLARSTAPFAVPPRSIAKVQTSGLDGSVRVGSAILEPHGSFGTPAAVEVLSLYRENGSLQAEVVSEPSDSMTAARLIGVRNSTESTGVAIFNPGAREASVSLGYRDSNGTVLGTTLKIPSRARVSSFLHDLIPAIPIGFLGSVDLYSSVPVSVSSVLMTDSAMSAWPVLDSSKRMPAQSSLVFSQIVAGANYSTQIILVNPTGDPLSGEIRLRDQSGAPLFMFLNEQLDSRIRYSVPGDGTAVIRVSSPDALLAGYAVLSADEGQKAPSSVLLIKVGGQGEVQTAAASIIGRPSKNSRLFLDHGLNRDTGIAIVNGNSSAVEVKMSVLYQNGERAAAMDGTLLPEIVLTLQHNEQSAFMAGNEFKGLVPGLYVLSIEASGPVSALAYRCTAQGEGRIVLTSFPLVNPDVRPFPLSWPGPSTYFPLMADGGGYTTEFLFVNSSDHRASSRLSFFDSNGNALPSTYR